jgi:hypothetical protein
MDVQVIENWSEIEGKVAAVTPHPELAGYVTAAIDVERVSPVEGYANLFSSAAGSQVEINIPAAKGAGLGSGATIRMRIRKAGPASAFADPDSIRR